MGICDKWALRACGDLGKWTFGVKDTLGQMDVLGPMSIEANGHWGPMGTWDKWGPGKISTRANGQLGQMDFGGKWVYGTNEL